MSVVTYFVETTDGYLADAAETQFGALAATVGTLGSLACTIVLIFVAINLVFQWRSLDGRQTFWICVKMSSKRAPPDRACASRPMLA